MQQILALMAAVSCAALGGVFARRIRAREEILVAWDGALQRMESAVSRGCELSEVLAEGAGRQVPLLAEAEKQLRLRPAASPREAAAALPWEDCLLPEEREILTACLEGLFSPVPQTQLLSLRLARSQWRTPVQSARESRRKYGRLCVRLGCLAGAALFILIC